ncbi:MAG: UDP-glucose 6-dehydrogenase [Tenericutes bacterium ADurb.Bin087]|nr:MAG: UDP-glucose 6-dehydrogenase [Tenericutes bacterium ADurb.Bin087]
MHINKITVVGLGYVGLAQALLFNDDFNVVGYDTNPKVVASLNRGLLHIKDEDFARALTRKKLVATSDTSFAFQNTNIVIIATPTHFDEDKQTFDLSSIDVTLEKIIASNTNPIVIIKSTVNVGATKFYQAKYPQLKLFFVPEFLREGHALFDNYYPARIVVGYDKSEAKQRQIAIQIANLFRRYTKSIDDVPLLITGTEEAEAIKLFANSYLALRVSFFNEIDTYALTKDLAVEDIIAGISLDPRIGNHYNNPSFGYGGYCLPKDSKQLKAHFSLIPEELISATVSANSVRKTFIANYIARIVKNSGNNDYVVGIYRLTMKKDADNMRESSIIDVVTLLAEQNIKMIIYEPLISDVTYKGIMVLNNLATFKKQSDLIVTNRMHADLKDVAAKVFTRDVYSRD